MNKRAYNDYHSKEALSDSDNSYDTQELEKARYALEQDCDSGPLKRLVHQLERRPLGGRDRRVVSNLWEGDIGLMEHVTRGFPLPPTAPVYNENDMADMNTAAKECAVGNSTSSSAMSRENANNNSFDKDGADKSNNSRKKAAKSSTTESNSTDSYSNPSHSEKGHVFGKKSSSSSSKTKNGSEENKKQENKDSSNAILNISIKQEFKSLSTKQIPKSSSLEKSTMASSLASDVDSDLVAIMGTDDPEEQTSSSMSPGSSKRNVSASVTRGKKKPAQKGDDLILALQKTHQSVALNSTCGGEKEKANTEYVPVNKEEERLFQERFLGINWELIEIKASLRKWEIRSHETVSLLRLLSETSRHLKRIKDKLEAMVQERDSNSYSDLYYISIPSTKKEKKRTPHSLTAVGKRFTCVRRRFEVVMRQKADLIKSYGKEHKGKADGETFPILEKELAELPGEGGVDGLPRSGEESDDDGDDCEDGMKEETKESKPCTVAGVDKDQSLAEVVIDVDQCNEEPPKHAAKKRKRNRKKKNPLYEKSLSEDEIDVSWELNLLDENEARLQKKKQEREKKGMTESQVMSTGDLDKPFDTESESVTSDDEDISARKKKYSTRYADLNIEEEDTKIYPDLSGEDLFWARLSDLRTDMMTTFGSTREVRFLIRKPKKKQMKLERNDFNSLCKMGCDQLRRAHKKIKKYEIQINEMKAEMESNGYTDRGPFGLEDLRRLRISHFKKNANSLEVIEAMLTNLKKAFEVVKTDRAPLLEQLKIIPSADHFLNDIDDVELKVIRQCVHTEGRVKSSGSQNQNVAVSSPQQIESVSVGESCSSHHGGVDVYWNHNESNPTEGHVSDTNSVLKASSDNPTYSQAVHGDSIQYGENTYGSYDAVATFTGNAGATFTGNSLNISNRDIDTSTAVTQSVYESAPHSHPNRFSGQGFPPSNLMSSTNNPTNSDSVDKLSSRASVSDEFLAQEAAHWDRLQEIYSSVNRRNKKVKTLLKLTRRLNLVKRAEWTKKKSNHNLVQEHRDAIDSLWNQYYVEHKESYAAKYCKHVYYKNLETHTPHHCQQFVKSLDQVKHSLLSITDNFRQTAKRFKLFYLLRGLHVR